MATTVPAATTEDAVSKYKRLLNLARSSLEANQVVLVQKDDQIKQLLHALEEERAKKQTITTKILVNEDGTPIYPRRILCRVDVEGVIWILTEYESSDDDWKSFTDEESLQDYLARVPGVPLICPRKCLSTEESTHIIEECKKKIERIAEEFRRYKVRSEITMKQKESQIAAVSTNAAMNNGNSPFMPNNNSASSNLSMALEKALSLNNNSNDINDEMQRMKQQYQDNEQKYRIALEKVTKENELLKSKGAESVLASQWRSRYESCLKDKEELQQKLQLYINLSEEIENSGKTLDELYFDLLDELKCVRRKVSVIVQEYHTKRQQSYGNTHTIHDQDDDDDDDDIIIASAPQHSNNTNDKILSDILQDLHKILNDYKTDHYEIHTSTNTTSNINNNTDPSVNPSLAENKVQYIRQMVFQFLTVREPEVKQHIERALVTLLRFTNEEKEVIESRQKEELDAQDPLTTITSFFGSLST